MSITKNIFLNRCLRTAMLALMTFSYIGPVDAGQFRSSKRITSPKTVKVMAASPNAVTTPMAVKKQFPALDRRLVEKLARTALEKWNTPQFAESLAQSFPNRERVLDTQTIYIPKDARLRVLAVQGVQTLSQELDATPGGPGFLISTVSVTVKTQMEYTSASSGFSTSEGTNELIMRVTQKLKSSGGGS